jgi:hypothetical protein
MRAMPAARTVPDCRRGHRRSPLREPRLTDAKGDDVVPFG